MSRSRLFRRHKTLKLARARRARKTTTTRRLGLEWLEQRRMLATITVNDTSDTTDNPTNVTVGTLGADVTLIDAINAANNSGGSNTISLASGAAYTFDTVNNNWYGPNALPAITSDITIAGNGATLTRSTDPNTAGFRFFYVSDGLDPDPTGAGSLALDNLTISNGLAQGGAGGAGGGGGGAGMGGAVFNQGTLSINGVTFVQNSAIGGEGGASTVDNALTGGGGGGLGGNGGDGTTTNDGGGGGGGMGGKGGDASNLNGGGGGGGGLASDGGTSNGGGGGGGGVTTPGGGGSAGAGGSGGDNGGDGGDPASPGEDGGDYGGGGGGGVSDTDADETNGGRGGLAGGGGGGGGPLGYGGDGGVGGGGGGGLQDANGGDGGFGGGGGGGGPDSGYGGSGGFGGGAGGNGGSFVIGSEFGGGAGGQNTSGGPMGGGGGAGLGGAIFNYFGSTITIVNSTFSANSAVGGNGGNADADNSDVPAAGGNGGDGYGGAIFNDQGSVTLTNVTLADNVVTAGGGGTATTSNTATDGTAGVVQGGAVYNYGALIASIEVPEITGPGGNLSLTNTLAVRSVAFGTLGTGTVIPFAVAASNVDDVFNDGGRVTGSNNIIGVGDGTGNNLTGLSSPNDIGTNATPFDAGLAASLADNATLTGTQTYALLSGSAAINFGTSTGAPTVDQRGYTRDSQPDAGSYEVIASMVTSVTTTTANGAYNAGKTITIDVNFSEPVTVTGTPQLALNDGASASYTSGSGTSTLVFTYTVAAGQNTPHLDEASPTALTLNGGSINDPSSNPAVITLPAPGATGSLGANSQIVIDTMPPDLEVDPSPLQPNPTAYPQIVFNATFSESVTGFIDTSKIHITGTAADAATAAGTPLTATIYPLNSGNALIAKYQIAVTGMISNGTVTVQIDAGAAHDPAGNESFGSNGPSAPVQYYYFHQIGNTMNISGTTGSDLFLIDYTSSTTVVIGLDGASRTYNTADVPTINFNGDGSTDTTVAFGATGDVTTTLTSTGVTVQGSNYTLNLTNTPLNYVYGTSGSTATLDEGSAGYTFVGAGSYAYDYNAGGATTSFVSGFGTVNTTATHTGDTAYFYSVHDAKFTAGPAMATLVAGPNTINASSFALVAAYAAGDGSDSAELDGSSGVDVFNATPTEDYMSGSGFFNETFNFPMVTAVGEGGGDVAYLADAPKVPGRVAASDGAAGIAGSGYESVAETFPLIYATANNSGDQAKVDQVRPNTVTTNGNTTTLKGSGGTDILTGFTVTPVTSGPNQSAVDFVMSQLGSP